ncbi:hypothetical protein N790_07090 [Arenimonas malthae CC-JY-1]|uniref:Acetyltransferase n=2 Tax=Arenimonas TaxID=490567 RepID=A0A091B8U9_9GAMM|nr:hypothetical protein N790_07090 [Arenimonas malthae CC-JY-1]
MYARLGKFACIGSQNAILRAPRGVTWGRAIFRLGTWSKITVGHVIDCTRSVRLGDYSILAGRGSQVWTHGYLHAAEGIDRFRIDGSVTIGNNVYIGSGCVVNAAVKIGDAITVGSGATVSTSLRIAGLYVSQPLRMVELDYTTARQRHPQINVPGLVETVVHKRPANGS